MAVATGFQKLLCMAKAGTPKRKAKSRAKNDALCTHNADTTLSHRQGGMQEQEKQQLLEALTETLNVDNETSIERR